VAAATTITAAAPVRTCDCGGWTDTWFARRGAVFHVAVNPGVRVSVEAREAAGGAPASLTVHAENYGHRYAVVPGTRPWVRHPLIEAAIESAGVPARMTIDLRVRSAVPPGASTGTSAAVCVAIVGALRALWGRPIDAADVARAAHRVEVDLLGQQSGVQDQYGAAFGGINYIEMTDYPSAERRDVNMPAPARAALEAQLLLVYLGRTHDSSAIHEEVIRGLERPGSAGRAALDDLRAAAAAARDAAEAGNLEALGAAMRACTEGQRRLHPSLVSADAQRVIDAASASGALGWKVNGAGGEGGSLAILCPPGADRRAAITAAMRAWLPACQVLPTAIAPRGLEITIGRAASREAGA
jgi:D-glycero-alpha-D-manno-heptose-7-phosphate kinase